MGSHFAPFFKTIDRLTTVGAQDYVSARLRKVTRGTLKHELSPLRRLAKWAHARGCLAQMPEIETPGSRVLGTPVPNARKRVSLIFTADEVAAIVARLPEYWSAPRDQVPYPVRARYVVAWETALRAPHHRQAPRAHGLPSRRHHPSHPRRDRQEPLRPRATDHLRRPRRPRQRLPGLIFGHHDCTMLVRRAAKAAGIDAYRAERISDYDFRHSGATHLGRSSANLPGVMYLLGHKQPATTARYMRPQKDAAAEVLHAAAVH